MSEIHDIKRRLSAVGQTRKITNAMYLISSTRMKREAKRAEYAREYIHRIRATVKDIINKSTGITHPYLQKQNGSKAAFLVIAGDKGLCGTYNSAVLKYAFQLVNTHSTHYIETVGHMATDFFIRQGMTPDAETFGAGQDATLKNARQIVESLFLLYKDDLIDEVYIVYTRFVNASVSYPDCVRLLPLSMDDYSDVTLEADYITDMLYEPSPEEVFSLLVPQYAVGLVFAALAQSSASEQCARMNAMHSATKNADDMAASLTRQYHIERQLAITNEIIEITAGASSADGYGKKR